MKQNALTLSIFSLSFFSYCYQSIIALPRTKPTIHVRWEGEKNFHHLSNNHLREWPLFNVYDEHFFNQHRLPKSSITFRNDSTKAVDNMVLENLLEEVILEVQQGKTHFKNFTLIHERTFNKKLTAGSLVLKFNDYPFIAKIFMENPYSFVHPFKKGWVQYFFFLIGGGVNRHIAGFTRITNLEHVNKLISHDMYWSSSFDTPRKWFWTPSNNKNLEIIGYNIGSRDYQKITIPGTYCIITDAIEVDESDQPTKENMQETIKNLCCYLDFCIDFNTDNFIVERGTKKIVIIDTEHYPTLVGITHKPECVQSYASLVFFVIKNSVRNIFLNTHPRSGIPFDMRD